MAERDGAAACHGAISPTAPLSVINHLMGTDQSRSRHELASPNHCAVGRDQQTADTSIAPSADERPPRGAGVPVVSCFGRRYLQRKDARRVRFRAEPRNPGVPSYGTSG